MPIPIPAANLYWDDEEARAAVAGFNGNLQYLAGEVMARRIFAQAQPAHAASLVVSVNALMGAQASQNDQALIAESLQGNWDTIVDRLWALPPDVLDNHPDALCELSQEVLPPLVNVDRQNRRDYVLATKLLHWLSRGRTPIVDGLARNKVRALQAAWDGDPVEVTRILPCWEEDGTDFGGIDYARWVRFYSALVNGLDLTNKQDLLQHDWDTQRHALQGHAPQDWTARNTLVRVIDKYLWYRPH